MSAVLALNNNTDITSIVTQMGGIAAQRGEDKKTKRAYRKYAQRYIDWCFRANMAPGRVSLIAWRDLLAEKFKPSTVNVHLSAVRALVDELFLLGEISETVHKQMSSVKGLQRHGSKAGFWMNKSQFQKLIDQQSTETMKGLRDRAILALGAYCGLRREEIASLTIDDISVIDGRAYLDIEGKNNKLRTVPVHPKALVIIGAWLRAAGIKTGHAIRSVNRGGAVSEKGMSTTAVYQNVKRMGKDAGLDIAPHDLRRTCGRAMHDGGAALSDIQTFLGHENPETTQTYIGLKVDDAVEAMKAINL
jgi:integrase